MIGDKILNKSKIISITKDTLNYLTVFFPIAFSMAVCFGFTEITGIMLSVLAILFLPQINEKMFMPVYASFMLLGYSATAFDYNLSFLSCFICGVLMTVSAFFYKDIKKLISAPAVSGVMIATALTVTVLFTTDYFGIGASGNTAPEMIRSYISLGFHPNWRGVLYGTVVMVIMITFPRKFKKFNKTVSASFIAIVFTLILNLFLNPSFMKTAINEIPDGTANDLIAFISDTAKFTFFKSPDSTSILSAISIGFALFITGFYAISVNENAKKADYISSGISYAIGGGIFNLPFPYGINKDKSSVIPRLISAAVLIIVFIFGEEYILRIPLHSCSVVLIVGAWQNVRWGEIKKAFSSISSVAVFAVSAIACLALDFASGIFVATLLSIIFSDFSKKKAINS